MIKVGVTGNICSGKSAVTMMFGSLPGVKAISCDDIVHDALKSTRIQDSIVSLAKRYGLTITGEDVREFLMDKFFQKSELSHLIETLLHDEVFATVDNIIMNSSYAVYCVETPILFERNHQDKFDRVIAVWCDPLIAEERARVKGITAQYHERLAHQTPQTQQASRSHYIINNSLGREHTLEQVRAIHCGLMRLESV